MNLKHRDEPRPLLSPELRAAPVLDRMCSRFVLTLTLQHAGRFNLRRDWNSLLGLVGRHLVWPPSILARLRAFLVRRCIDNEQWRGHEALSDEAFLDRHGRWRGAYEDSSLFFYIDEYVKDARTYVGMVVLISFYRLLLRRLQGEASLLAEPDEGQPVEPLDRPERFLVRKLGRDFLVAAADIECLQASGNYVNLRVRGHDYPLRSTIVGIESRLDPRLFTRVHRSYIVNLGQVASIEPLDAGEARLHLLDGTIIPCSRRYRQALRERIDGAATSA